MRRILVPAAAIGRIELGEAEAHHLRDVLRLGPDDAIEVFDAAGNRGAGRIVSATQEAVVIEVFQMHPAEIDGPRLTIASAIPKGPRADWMVEKLSELGVDRFIPLITDRSVVRPRGGEKAQRWQRVAGEAARQSGRKGVMEVEPLTPLKTVLAKPNAEQWAYLSLEEDAKPILELLKTTATERTLFVGPEGGWSDGEISAFRAAKMPAVALTQTVLRIETAAMAAAAVVMSASAREITSGR